MSASFFRGQRVKYIGITGRADGPTGRIIRQYKSGDVRVRWDDDRCETVHPEDIQNIDSGPVTGGDPAGPGHPQGGASL